VIAQAPPEAYPSAVVGLVMLLLAPLAGLWFILFVVSGGRLNIFATVGLIRLVTSRLFLFLVLLALLATALAANVRLPDDLWRQQDASPIGPPIARQKQDGHVKGTPQYKQRVKQGKPTSTWDDSSEADRLTREAWRKGVTAPGRPGVRDYDAGRRIGTDPQGRPQTRIRVSQDERGRIHGWPSGPGGP
jgi:hypothetical protein